MRRKRGENEALRRSIRQEIVLSLSLVVRCWGIFSFSGESRLQHGDLEVMKKKKKSEMGVLLLVVLKGGGISASAISALVWRA